ncbi:hypothetical protein GCM10029964_025770 [Kibdelosporangium lantanae]
MAMMVIEGKYRIVGASPDGDSVRFYPNDPADWDRVGGPHKVRRNASGGAQLRLDAIDALETHFLTKAGEQHQPHRFGDAAASELLDWLGFTNVVRGGGGKVTKADPAEVPGYILTRTADVYGRCVAFAGKEPRPRPVARTSSSTSPWCSGRSTTTSSRAGSRIRPSTGSCSLTCVPR